MTIIQHQNTVLDKISVVFDHMIKITGRALVQSYQNTHALVYMAGH